MDRRQFLVSVGRAGLVVAATALLEACDSAAPTGVSSSPSRIPGIASLPAPSVPTPGRLGPPSGPVGPPTRLRNGAIRDENARTGDRRWLLDAAGPRSTVEAFVDHASVAPGDTLTLHAAHRGDTVDLDWYRLGWYGGTGGRLVRRDTAVDVAPSLTSEIDPMNGRAEAAAAPAITVVIPGDWLSGSYRVVVRPRSQSPFGAFDRPGCAPFTVRPAGTASPAPVLFVSATTTWEAYNAWGGADLYDATSADSPLEASGRRATQVSFDRPYAIGSGAGYQDRWELPFVRWQEREGRDVDTCADVDLELNPAIAAGRRLIVFAGHHEYWSRPMRTTIENAIALGTNIAFLSANELYWQVRFEPSPLGPARRVTCFKSNVADPLTLTSPELTTCRWRQPPVNEPEAVVIGQQYGHIVARSADWIVAGAGHWLYQGTGLGDGDRIRNLVGQEYDTFFPDLAPPGTEILARSPVKAMIRPGAVASGPQPANPNVQTATIYTAESGATVLAAGTFQWSWALDPFQRNAYKGVVTPYDERLVRMTRNLFDRLGDGPA